MVKRTILTTLLLLLFSFSGAYASIVTVSSDPVWTNSGIAVNSGDSVNIHDATGSWTWATWGAPLFGPDGDPAQPGFLGDEWITNNKHGQLIGYLGTLDLNTFPRLLAQNDPNLFVIGTGNVTVTNGSSVTETLWLGFNDDFVSDVTDDNAGSVSVSVDPVSGSREVPEPGTMILLGFGFLGFAAFRRKYRNN